MINKQGARGPLKTPGPAGGTRNFEDKIRIVSRESLKASIVFLIILIVFFIGSTGFTRFNPIGALLSQGEFWDFIFTDFVPPSMGRLGSLFLAVMQTLYMALGATGISTVLALFLSFLGSSAITRSPALNACIRTFASILRNIPPLVWAFILVAAFGIGTVVGVLSLIVGTTGYLTRFFIEILDEAADETMEPLMAAGAAMPSIVSQALLPESMPGFIAWILYCVELNIRASTILGMVGAGGIGLLLMGYIKQFNYAAASTSIFAVAVIIIGVNLLTNYLRKQIMR
ncbi:MAG: phosphate/phosphonate ABC transporter permease [Spirochaetaceae bacterium]|jgi:phosphonate transport system permease protein|nr:phosphate/phosphonate ABC transporter permease [Spirochaetaceae bacterium]